MVLDREALQAMLDEGCSLEEIGRRVDRHPSTVLSWLRKHGLAALQFHHLDPSTKEFHIGHRGISRSIERTRAEAAKCVLLCANCHAAVEAGDAALP